MFLLTVPAAIASRVSAYHGKDEMSLVAGIAGSVFAIVSPLLIGISGIVSIIAFFSAIAADSVLSGLTSPDEEMGTGVRIIINIALFGISSLIASGGIPAGISSMRTLLRNALPYTEPQKQKRIVFAGVAAVSVIALIINISVTISSLGSAATARNHARQDIKYMELGARSESAENARVRMSSRIVDRNTSTNVYVVEIRGSLTNAGDTVRGGYFYVITVDGKGESRTRALFAYDDLDWPNETPRDEALTDARDYMRDFALQAE
jgi:hypothetical protein